MALCLAIVKFVKAVGHAETCEILAKALVQLSIEMPGAPLFSVMDQATHWAGMATQDEARAYALASYNRMTPRNQAAFLAYVKGSATV